MPTLLIGVRCVEVGVSPIVDYSTLWCWILPLNRCLPDSFSRVEPHYGAATPIALVYHSPVELPVVDGRLPPRFGLLRCPFGLPSMAFALPITAALDTCRIVVIQHILPPACYKLATRTRSGLLPSPFFCFVLPGAVILGWRFYFPTSHYLHPVARAHTPTTALFHHAHISVPVCVAVTRGSRYRLPFAVLLAHLLAKQAPASHFRALLRIPQYHYLRAGEKNAALPRAACLVHYPIRPTFWFAFPFLVTVTLLSSLFAAAVVCVTIFVVAVVTLRCPHLRG